MCEKPIAVSDLTPKMLKLIDKQPPRRIPGYWYTTEIAAMLKVTRSAIVLQVFRGNITPLDTRKGQEHMFADVDVYRYLANRKKPGRPKKSEQPDDS